MPITFKRRRADSTDWAILSPDVPIFRTDDGSELDHPWLLSFITCAAPVASRIGQPEAGDLLQKRIHRVLAIAQAYGYSTLVLGAWGCGAFHNDTIRTAMDFRHALENEFTGAFSDVVFAITDWSPERKYLGPFRDVFSAGWFLNPRCHVISDRPRIQATPVCGYHIPKSRSTSSILPCSRRVGRQDAIRRAEIIRVSVQIRDQCPRFAGNQACRGHVPGVQPLDPIAIRLTGGPQSTDPGRRSPGAVRSARRH